MLSAIYPKLPMRDPSVTKAWYTDQLSFEVSADYGDYLIIRKDAVEIHFFIFRDLNPLDNYGQVYIRVSDIDKLYQDLVSHQVAIHPNGPLEDKMWGMREFALLDPDHNLLTFGQSID